MIAKISSGAKVAGLANYLHGPGRENEHAYGLDEGGCVIGGNLMVEGDMDGRRWARDMSEAARLRPDIAKPVWHMSLRAAPEDPVLTDGQWREVAQQHAETMGWADRPWVMVRHGEDHVHVVVSRVGFDGTVWSNSNDRYRAREACLRVEQDFGLRSTTVAAPNRRQNRTQRLTQGEFAAAERTATPPSRTRTADRVRAARDHAVRIGGGRENFEAALFEAGVQWRANVASTGKMNGYSFHVPGHVDAQGQPLWWKASELDRSLSWGRLSKDLAPRKLDLYVPEVASRRTFERPSSYRRRVDEATTRVHVAHRKDSLRVMERQITFDQQGSGSFWKRRGEMRQKKTQQWVRNVETRAARRADLALVRASFPESRTSRMTPKLPSSGTFRAGVKAVDYARYVARLAAADEPQRSRGMSR